MAATGGGKIRTRRYHIASKPYAKGKQQPGLISRVTDTVKSIVPSWLQKYFKNGEMVEEEGGTPVEDQNNVAPPPNGNEETVPLPDGRATPEPSTSNTEPSTSRASLNFQDALSRPPLNRSHLHFASLDGSPALAGSSSLFSQPSTSSAPFGGGSFAVASSSFSLVKEIKDSSSQHEDDNISTTSGFSSRASDKDVPASKPAPLLWSPETDRTHSGSQPAQSSMKKPAFNLSVFGTSASTTMSNSVLNSSQLGDSPFYPGKTTYGGAAAARTARPHPGTPYQAPVRRQIKAKPAGAQPCGVTSATARRILQSLERMSSPLADAKRIPSTISSPLSTSLGHSDLDISHLQSKKKRLDPALPPVQKLVVPSAASLGGNRSMSFRPSLTPGGVTRAVEKTGRETPVRQSPQIPDAPPTLPQSTISLPCPLSSTPAANSTGSGGGKMKRERSIRPSSKKPEEEVATLPDLPAISLPISTFSLPTFSFSSPPPTSSVMSTANPMTPVAEEPVSSKEPPAASSPPCVPFTFSSPIVKATAASPPSFSPSSGFTFSAPAMKTGPSNPSGETIPMVVPVKSSTSESKDEFKGLAKPAKVLKQGSVLDILKGPGFASPARSSPSPETSAQTPASTQAALVAPATGFGDQFKPAAGSWNCDTCLLQNKPSDKKCVACQSPQPNADSSSKSDSKPAEAPSGFGARFAPPAGSWECDTCLVQNKPEVVRCVACDTAKPGTGVKPTLTLPAISEPAPSSSSAPASTTTATASTSQASGFLGFGDKFKKAEGAWECDVCMVENKAQDVKCVACQSAKPGAKAAAAPALPAVSTPASTAPPLGFGDKFKKPEGSWDCDVCCVQNKAEDQKCVACQSPKPGAKVEVKGFGSSSFGVQSSSLDSSSTGFKFGTSSSDSTSGGLKFGAGFSDSSTTTQGGFKFGNTSSDSNSTGFKFGAASSAGGFKFGGASTESASTETSSTGGFKFGGSAGGFKFGGASTETSSADKSSAGGFKFGGSSSEGFKFGSASNSASSASEEKKEDSQSTGAGLQFGAASETPADSNAKLSFTAFGSTPLPAEAASTTSAPNALPVFGKPTVTEPAATAPKFGEPASKEPALAATGFSFGKAEEKKDTSMPSGFSFGETKEAEKPAASLSFSFSKPDPPKDQPKPTFSFGKPPEKTDSADAPKPSFSFGQSASDATAPKPAFGFMASTSSTPATSNPAPSLFGTSGSAAPAANPAPNPAPATAPAPGNTFVFGQSASSETPKTFLFGQQQDTQSGSAAPSTAPAQPFLFGAASNTPTASFSFGGSAASTPASAAPGPSATPSPFVFNSGTPSSGFGSGQTPIFGQGSSQTSAPAFGAGASSFPAPASQPPAFGAKPNAAPVFGQQTNPTPAFGSSTAPSGQGFQFGGASAFGAPSNTTGVFTFGAAGGPAVTPAASPAMPAQQPPPGFSFSQTPAFNIGSSKNTFNAAPSGPHSITGRKIKTAIRRRK
ncbi:nuclear pore complex protein Nup153 isoform X2 [Chanos chanos]|uniref:Nuclear pore complex protein Nup153 n=1 Tax=Chanos chanos TaxID=29144 RepID=A0A6J2WHD2_CHACN|nr:nuclear pore complex protein Nup153 isoform X2 [Chanos chanos]